MFCFLPSAHHSPGSMAIAHAWGYVVTEALQGFCRAGQAIRAELMDDLIQAPIH